MVLYCFTNSTVLGCYYYSHGAGRSEAYGGLNVISRFRTNRAQCLAEISCEVGRVPVWIQMCKRYDMEFYRIKIGICLHPHRTNP